MSPGCTPPGGPLTSRGAAAPISLQRLPARIARVEVVPEADGLLLGLDPAEVDLAAVHHRREVDQPPIEIADDEVHRLQSRGGVAQLEERLGDVTARRAAPPRRRGPRPRLPRPRGGPPPA